MRINDTVLRVRCEVDGTKYEVGPVKASEAEKIQAWTGYGLREWEGKVDESEDPLAIKALLGLMRFRQGENVRFADLEVQDMDSVRGELVDERGRVVTILMKDGKPALDNGRLVLLFDGEPDAPLDQSSPNE